MTGLKIKIAHKRAGSEKWNVGEKAQRRKLIKVLQNMITQLQEEEEHEKA